MKNFDKHQLKIARDWLTRLRDPESKQAYGVLASSQGGYCCLGHLCLAAGKKFVGGGCEGLAALLPTSVVDLLGLGSNTPDVTVNGKAIDLDVLNDKYKLTLSQIADLVEADWIQGDPLRGFDLPKVVDWSAEN